MKEIRIPNFKVINKDSLEPNSEITYLSDVPKEMSVPTTCPDCGRIILGCLGDYGKGITCISCGCSFKYVYSFTLHE